MSSTPALQCLFCNHLNPAGASFCNDCGSQMHLQPCDRCRAIAKRTATACPKCGSSFTRPAAPEHHSAPAILETQLAEPALNPVGVATELMTLNQSGPTETGMTATRPLRTNWRVAALPILLVAIAMPIYFYSAPSVPVVKSSGVIQPKSGPATMLISTESTPSTIAVPADRASAPTVTPPKPISAESAPDEVPSHAPSVAGIARTGRPSSAADWAVKNRQDPLILKECPEAVATLGLCNPGAK
jgi:ribosomal protein L40E